MVNGSALKRSKRTSGQLSLDRFQASVHRRSARFPAGIGTNPTPSLPASPKRRVGRSASAWAAQVEQFLQAKAAESRVGEGWIRRMRWELCRCPALIRHLGIDPAPRSGLELTADHLQALRMRMGWEKATVALHFAALRQFARWAANPIAQLPGVWRLPSGQPSHRRWLTKGQLSRLLSAAQGREKVLRRPRRAQRAPSDRGPPASRQGRPPRGRVPSGPREGPERRKVEEDPGPPRREGPPSSVRPGALARREAVRPEFFGRGRVVAARGSPRRSQGGGPAGLASRPEEDLWPNRLRIRNRIRPAEEPARPQLGRDDRSLHRSRRGPHARRAPTRERPRGSIWWPGRLAVAPASGARSSSSRVSFAPVAGAARSAPGGFSRWIASAGDPAA